MLMILVWGSAIVQWYIELYLFGLNVDDVEAAAFAWLAYQRVHGLTGNLPSVTGATQAVSLGAIFPKM